MLCYEHKPIIGTSISRIQGFENIVLDTINTEYDKVYSYVILPNHYHILIKTDNIKNLLNRIFILHRKLASNWNKEDDSMGRKIWCNIMDSGIKGDRHFWATMNYIHNNPVKHGYVDKWQDWKFSSAEAFIKNEGKEKTLKIWKKYDISRMCKWDK